MATSEWKRSGSVSWVLDTETRRYRVNRVSDNVFIVNRHDKRTRSLTQFGGGHRTLARAQAWVVNDSKE